MLLSCQTPDTAYNVMREKSMAGSLVSKLFSLIVARLRDRTAVNYRLAPQYPFPCAIQDLLAACEKLVLPNPSQQVNHVVDLFLIQPPPDAAHRPVKPEHIVIAGDSAGGGISLALLQVIRDAGLPQPAGGVLISPWCDLTHSFPSVKDNTATVRITLHSEERKSNIYG
jgi:acetyl esterase/lipase